MRKKSSRSSSWRTRTTGSTRQIGNKFMLPTTSRQKLASQLPTITGRPRGHLIVTQPERVVRLSLIKVNTNELIPREKHPVDIENRAQYFVDAYKRGLTIPPILVHKLPSGEYEILDGHARVEAYRRLGVTEIPAIENGILESLGKGAKAVGHAIASSARVASQYGKKGLKFGERAAAHVGKVAEEGLTQAGRISRAYSGQVAPREELEHEERVAEIRARREPIQRERVREVFVTGSGPFGGTSSPLLSQPMLQEVRRSKWRVHRTSKTLRSPLRGKPDKVTTRERLKDLSMKTKNRAKKGYRTVKEWAQAPTPELYRLKKKNNPSYTASQLSQSD